MKLPIALAMGFVSVLTAACSEQAGSSVLTQDRLNEAEALWKKAALSEYEYDISVDDTVDATAYHVVVKGGEVTSMTERGTMLPRESWSSWSIAGLFDTLQEDLMGSGDPLSEAEFDATRGFPTYYSRQPAPGTPTAEWRIERFTPRGSGRWKRSVASTSLETTWPQSLRACNALNTITSAREGAGRLDPTPGATGSAPR